MGMETVVNNLEVAILMSTYNGDQYVSEQIESILKQSYTNWDLYIRDDNSNDNTVNVIKKFVKNDPRVHFFEAESKTNIGVTRSFFRLLSLTQADVYMFSDQDDVWMKDKVQITTARLKKYMDTPALVHSNLRIVDSELKPISYSMKERINNLYCNDKIHLLCENVVTGCTVGINKALKEKLLIDNLCFNNVKMHDWWIAIFAAFFGKVDYIKEPTILYRQHKGNVVGSNKKIKINQLSRSVKNVFEQAFEFSLHYQKEILDEGLNNELQDFVTLPEQSLMNKMNYFHEHSELKQNKFKNCIFKLVVFLRRD